MKILTLESTCDETAAAVVDKTVRDSGQAIQEGVQQAGKTAEAIGKGIEQGAKDAAEQGGKLLDQAGKAVDEARSDATEAAIATGGLIRD